MKKLVVITGPTASGKTAVAIQLAMHYRTEIINADSRQFYKKMDIGTAKPSKEELSQVRHHFIDTLELTEKYNAGTFEKEAIALIEKLFSGLNILILTGGSGLYIDAVCKGIDDLPESSQAIRDELTQLLNSEGIQKLQDKLMEADPEIFFKTDINNPHRLIRALELNLLTGKKISELRKGEIKKRNFQIIKIGLLLERDELYDRINKRVDQMFEKGLLEEALSLQNYRHENALQTVGYKEIFDYLDKKITLPEAISLIKQNTRNYAKRQMTWFRKDPEIQWFDPAESDKMIEYIDKDY